jgi:hypothetical protein
MSSQTNSLDGAWAAMALRSAPGPTGFGGEPFSGADDQDGFEPATAAEEPLLTDEPGRDVGERKMTERDLPPPDTKRWVMRRKAQVVAGVRCGLISLDEACRRYTLSVEEFLSWQRLIDSHGVRGLRATRLQDYRSGRGRMDDGSPAE